MSEPVAKAALEAKIADLKAWRENLSASDATKLRCLQLDLEIMQAAASRQAG